jgi:hypothetical protein
MDLANLRTQLSVEKKKLDDLSKEKIAMMRAKPINKKKLREVETKIAILKPKVQTMHDAYNKMTREMAKVVCKPGDVNVNGVCKSPCPIGKMMNPSGMCNPISCPTGFTLKIDSLGAMCKSINALQ